ncbi:MAG: ice-binding family protein [Tenuifilaceae bacterium]|nr:ice-binding family protein [Tenuifilaceae bacterium]
MRLKIVTPILALLIPILFAASCNKDANTLYDGLILTTMSINPLNNGSEIATHTVITITFNEVMDSTTINPSSFIIKQGETNIVGVVEYSGITATFIPAKSLSVTTNYTATITTAVKSISGKSLAKAYEWSFTISGNESGSKPINNENSENPALLAKATINSNTATPITNSSFINHAATRDIRNLALTNLTGYKTFMPVTADLRATDLIPPKPLNLTASTKDLIAAYNDAARHYFPNFVEFETGNIAGLKLTPGIYKWTSTITLPSGVTVTRNSIDARIFQITDNQTTSSGIKVTLIESPKVNNIFWQVSIEASLDTIPHYQSIISSITGIGFKTGAYFNRSSVHILLNAKQLHYHNQTSYFES